MDFPAGFLPACCLLEMLLCLLRNLQVSKTCVCWDQTSLLACLQHTAKGAGETQFHPCLINCLECTAFNSGGLDIDLASSGMV